MNKEICELNIDELNAVVGGGSIKEGVETTIKAMTTTVGYGVVAALVIGAVALSGKVTVK